MADAVDKITNSVEKAGQGATDTAQGAVKGASKSAGDATKGASDSAKGKHVSLNSRKRNADISPGATGKTSGAGGGAADHLGLGKTDL